MLLLVFAIEMVCCFLKWKHNLLCLQQKYESITISGGSHNSVQIHRAKLASEKPTKPLNLGWIDYLSTGELSYPLSGGSDNKESSCSAGDWVRSLGWKDPLEKGMATHSSIPAWRIPRAGEPGGLQSMVLQRVGHDWSDWAHIYIF